MSARSRQQNDAGSGRVSSGVQELDRRKEKMPAARPAPRRIDLHEGAEELEPRAYHDLPDKEEELKLGAAEQGQIRGSSTKEPRSALEHYEQAVEKEIQGSLGDSVRLYRRAFKVRS